MDLTVDNIEARLQEAAENLPGPDRDETNSWGQSFAQQAVRSAGHSLKLKLKTVLTEFLVNGSKKEATLAAASYPELAGVSDGIPRALKRRDLGKETRQELVAALGRAVSMAALDWSTDYREYFGGPRSRPLIFGAVLWDHEWFLDNIKKVLGSKPSDAKTGLWFVLRRLNRPEVTRLRDELTVRAQSLGKAYVDKVLPDIEDQLGGDTLKDGDIRWES